MRVSGDGPLNLRLLAKTPGLPAEALAGPPPKTVAWAAHFSGYTLATKAFTI